MNTEPAEWDRFVAAHAHGYHEQTGAYAEDRIRYGFEIDRAIVREGSRIIGGAQMLVQRTPFGRYARVYRAPFAEDGGASAHHHVIREMMRMACDQRYRSLRVDTFPDQVEIRAALEAHGFRPSEAWFGRMVSNVVELPHSDGELLKRIPSRKARYSVRFAERMGVEVCANGPEAIEQFIELRKMSVAHHGYRIFADDVYRKVYEQFAAHGRAHVLIAQRDEQPLAAAFLIRGGDRVYLVWVGTHRGEEERKLLAGYLLQYRAFIFARDLGCTFYDFIGTSPFKRKFTEQSIEWAPPLRIFLGPLHLVRERLMDAVWKRPRLRRTTNALARRWGLRPAMPY